MPVRVCSQEEKETLRLKMLDAGFPLLKESGMTHTSISKITEAAGIGVSTFCNFRKTKEAYMYMSYLIRYHRRQKLPLLADERVLAGRRKMDRSERGSSARPPVYGSDRLSS